MDFYGYLGFLAGIAIAWQMWRFNDLVPGSLVYRAICDYTGKLALLLDHLDDDFIYDDYVNVHKAKISYFNYCRAVEAYRPVARENLRKFYWPYFLHYMLKRNLPLIVIVVPIFIFTIHWLLIGIILYAVLRYVYHHFTVVRSMEPLTLTNILSANAVLYYKSQNKQKKR